LSKNGIIGREKKDFFFFGSEKRRIYEKDKCKLG